MAARRGGGNDGATSFSKLYPLGLLTLVYVLHGVDRQLVPVTLEMLRSAFHLNDKQLGAVSGLAYGVAFAAACLPIGVLVDRVNRRNLLAGLLALWSLATGLTGFAASYATLLAARMGCAAFESGGNPAALSIIADTFPPRRRATAMGVFYLGAGVGAAIAGFGGGYLAQHYGWRAAFFMAGGPGLLLAVLLFTTLREPIRGRFDEGRAAAGTEASGLRALGQFRRPALTNAFLATLLGGASASITGAWLTSFYVRTYGVSIAHAGAIVALVLGLGISLGTLLGGWVADRIGGASLPRRAILLGVTLAAGIPFILLGTLLGDMRGSALFMFIEHVLAGMCIPIGVGLVVNLVGSGQRGVIIGAYQLSVNLIGYGIGPVLIGGLSDHIGGAKSLAYALAMALPVVYVWGAIHAALAAWDIAAESRSRASEAMA